MHKPSLDLIPFQFVPEFALEFVKYKFQGYNCDDRWRGTLAQSRYRFSCASIVFHKIWAFLQTCNSIWWVSRSFCREFPYAYRVLISATFPRFIPFAGHRNRLQILQSPLHVSTSQLLIVVDCVIWWEAECRLGWGSKLGECAKQVLTRISPGWLLFCETLNPEENVLLQFIVSVWIR